MKTIRRFFNNAEAEFAQLLLVSAGIEAVLADENANTLGPGFASGGVRLQVPDDATERALEVLKGANERFSPLPDEFGLSEEIPDALEAPRLENFEKVRELVPAGLCLLAAMGAAWALFLLLAPLNWTHSSLELARLGFAAADKKDYVKAVKCMNASLAGSPRNERLFYDRGIVFFEAKNYEKAIADFSEAIRLNSRYTRSYRMRGNSYKRIGKNDLALEDFNKAIYLEPTNSRGFYLRGWLYSKTGNAEGAIEDYQRGILLSPMDYLGYNNLAWLYATWPEDNVRNGAKASELAKKACELTDWKKPSCIGTLAAAAAETGNFDDAVRYQQQALELVRGDNTVDAKILHQMAEALMDYQQKKAYRDLKE